jgi:flagellar hook-associated protein 2
MANSTNAVFTGASRYSSDFQAILDRATKINSLYLTQLQQQRQKLSDESTALQSLRDKFTTLRGALDALQSATGVSSYTSSVSNGAIVKATLSSGALAGTYQIEVTSLGSYSTSISKDTLPKVTDPGASSISTASSFTLAVDGSPKTITPASQTLNALAQAINDAKVGVIATVINVGSSSSPDYRLSLQAEKLGAVSIALTDGTNSLIDTISTGSLATYKLNGLATTISSNTREVTIAPGLTVQLLKQSDPGDAVTITVSRSTETLSNALTSLVSAYNGALDELNKHRGQKPGALAASSVIQSLADALRSVSSFQAANGTITTLEQLGLSFTDEGKLSFDASAFSSASKNFTEVAQFLGSTSGGGFLGAAMGVLKGITETDGMLPEALEQISSQMSLQDGRIAAEEDRVELMRENLQNRLAQADALIASMEQQVIYFTGLFNTLFFQKEKR